MIKPLGSTISSSHQHPSHNPNLRVKSRAHVLTACCQELRPSESMVDHYKGLEAPQFPFKKIAWKLGASDFLTAGWHRNQGIQDLQRTLELVSMKPPYLFVGLKAAIPTSKMNPFPPQVLQETLPSNRIKDIERTQATFTSPSSTWNPAQRAQKDVNETYQNYKI